jgi:phosphopantothenoylcysteine decarboxylase/phosphopantothenate--cysteine ligase
LTGQNFIVLTAKKILLGVTGGIAAYKSAELCRLLMQAGAQLQVVMTHSAQAFITPLTFQTLTQRPVYTQVLEGELASGMGHIDLARWAEMILIAPASAHCLAQLAHGLAADLLTTLCLVSTAPIYLAPAMNQQMWQHAATQANCATLRTRGVKLWGPGVGEQACGEVGPGRMLEPSDIVSLIIKNTVAKPQEYCFVITAGPTQEPIDPVRYISNRSSGKMGFALAQALSEQGYPVYLIHGPVSVPAPHGLVKKLKITTAEEMHDAVHQTLSELSAQHKKSVFISVAAVGDFKVKSPALEKRKKAVDLSLGLTLECEFNPDILASVGQLEKNRPEYCVGFALETADRGQALDYAKKKLEQKNLDMIVLNRLEPDIAIDQDYNAVTVLFKKTIKQKPIELGKAPKIQIAQELVSLILEELQKLSELNQNKIGKIEHEHEEN